MHPDEGDLAEAKADRLLNEWLAEQGCPDEPIDPVARANTWRRIRAHVQQRIEAEAEWARVVASEVSALNGSPTENYHDDEEVLLDQLLDKLEHNEPVDSNAVRDLMHRVDVRIRPPGALKAEGAKSVTRVADMDSPQGESVSNSMEGANDHAI